MGVSLIKQLGCQSASERWPRDGIDLAELRCNEHAAVNFYLSDNFGVKLGRVRNPFGFWDDFSLFRNLSALKTDPVRLGGALRRADLGFTVFGNAGRFAYEAGVLQGGSTLTNKDVNDFKDVVLKVGIGWSRFDLAGNVYDHDGGRDAEPQWPGGSPIVIE